MMEAPFELSAQNVRKSTDPNSYTFETTEDTAPLDAIVGQDRAVRAIEFGIGMPGQGYNIFAVGPPGTGRTTAVKRFLDANARERCAPPGWCYVYNFEDPRRPMAIDVPSGRAIDLRDAMRDLVSQFEEEIPRTLEGEVYEQRRREIMLSFQAQQQDLLAALEGYLNERGFALLRAQMGLTIAPMRDGKVMEQKEYEQLSSEERKRLEDYRPDLQDQLDRTMRQTRQLDRDRRQAIQDATDQVVGFMVDQLMAEVHGLFGDCERVLKYLTAVRNDVIEHADGFSASEKSEGAPGMPIPRQPVGRRYQVNILDETRGTNCAPVIVLDNPTYQNLFGRIEHRAEYGAVVTDYTQIRAGALHRANGGYLIVDARDMVVQGITWEALKRSLQNQEIKIEEPAQFYGLVSAVSLEPEPIPCDVKIVLIGDEQLYQLLNIYDEDFQDYFRVKAEFGTTMPRDKESIQTMARLVGDLARKEKLLHLDPAAVAGVVDEASRYAQDQNRLTTRMSEVADLVRQASYWAGKHSHDVVSLGDVQRAVDERTFRQRNAYERYIERISDGVVYIDTRGEAIGQINGLSVIQSAGFSFGIPSRVTAKTFIGRAGVVSIDREVKMSGPIHDKGQLILSAWLASHFAQQHALNLSATLTFEQLYSGVEGDSASSTELYALLSSLADIPVRQDLAVTGSVNQSGRIQPIGGANAKIEGFFDVCTAFGLTGTQGVLVPASNVQHLMVRQDVAAAVERGEFHVYAIRTIEEGIELLTGMPAGEADTDGNYADDTVFGRVQAKLDTYYERSDRDMSGRVVSTGRADSNVDGV